MERRGTTKGHANLPVESPIMGTGQPKERPGLPGEGDANPPEEIPYGARQPEERQVLTGRQCSKNTPPKRGAKPPGTTGGKDRGDLAKNRQKGQRGRKTSTDPRMAGAARNCWRHHRGGPGHHPHTPLPGKPGSECRGTTAPEQEKRRRKGESPRSHHTHSKTGLQRAAGIAN